MSDDIDKEKLDAVRESFEKAKTQKEQRKSEVKERESASRILAKYFVHGIAFSLLFSVLAIAWALIFVILVLIGFILGLIIGIIILILIVGGLNSLITSLLWFRVKTSFFNVLGHGIVLTIALVIANSIFVLAPSLLVPGIATTIITLIIGSFIDGFIVKKIAGWWEEGAEEAVPEAVEAEWRYKNL